MTFIRSASVSVRFVVIGGSIAGLSAAFALGAVGHQVVLLEEQTDWTEVTGSIRCPPNMTKVLRSAPGSDELFHHHSTQLDRIVWKNGVNLETLGMSPLNPAVMSDLPDYYYIVPYQGLCQLLKRGCDDNHVRIRYGISATDVIRTSKEVEVHCSDGSIETADVIIVADGRASGFREVILETEVEHALGHEVFGCSFQIPAEVVRNNPQLTPFCVDHEWVIHAGCESSVSTSYNPHRGIINVEVTANYTLDRKCGDDYFAYGDLPDIDLSKYDACIQELFHLAQDVHPTTQKLYDLDDWIGLGYRAALIGDAAHSSPIHGSFNASTAIEDAFVLGYLFSYLSSPLQIPFLLASYQDLRHARTRAILTSEYIGLQLISLPPGPQRNLRDKSFASTLEVTDSMIKDPTFTAPWADYMNLCTYDPQIAVDDWWSQAGRNPRGKKKSTASPNELDPRVQQTDSAASVSPEVRHGDQHYRSTVDALLAEYDALGVLFQRLRRSEDHGGSSLEDLSRLYTAMASLRRDASETMGN